MIKGKSKFVQSNFEVEELGTKRGLFTDGKSDATAANLNKYGNNGVWTYNPYAFQNFIERRDTHILDRLLLDRDAPKKEGWTEYSTRLATLSPKYLTDEQLAVVIGKQALAEKEYNRSYKGMHFVDGGRIDINNMEKALAENKAIFVREQEKRSNLNKEIEKQQQITKEEKDRESVKTDEIVAREHFKTNEQIRYMKSEMFEQAKAAAPIVQAQKEANKLKNKELDMTTLDVNEFIAIDIITKHQLQNAQKFEEFTAKHQAGDVETRKDMKALEASLKIDGKFSAKNDYIGLKAGINALISENAEAIEKYLKGKDALNALTNSSPNPVTGVEKTEQLRK